MQVHTRLSYRRLSHSRISSQISLWKNNIPAHRTLSQCLSRGSYQQVAFQHRDADPERFNLSASRSALNEACKQSNFLSTHALKYSTSIYTEKKRGVPDLNILSCDQLISQSVLEGFSAGHAVKLRASELEIAVVSSLRCHGTSLLETHRHAPTHIYQWQGIKQICEISRIYSHRHWASCISDGSGGLAVWLQLLRKALCKSRVNACG